MIPAPHRPGTRSPARGVLPVGGRRVLGGRRGYVMIIALILLALIAVIGSSTLQVAGIDQRIAVQNRKHMMVLNTAIAGTEHARYEIQHNDPPDEGIDSGADTYDDFVTTTEAETDFGGVAYTHNLGVYYVTATFHRCGNPPPGYTTEMGRSGFRSDYWEMESTGRMTDTTYSSINETEAVSSSMVRKVMRGRCKVR